MSSVGSGEEAISNCNEGSLYAVMGSDAGLERLIELVVRYLLMDFALSKVLLRKVRLEIGRCLLCSLGSRPGFLWMGVTEAILKHERTIPD